MIHKLISAAVCRCSECEAIIVYYPASQGLPNVCQKCGTPHNVELTQQERTRLERVQQQRQQGQSYTIRF